MKVLSNIELVCGRSFGRGSILGYQPSLSSELNGTVQIAYNVFIYSLSCSVYTNLPFFEVQCESSKEVQTSKIGIDPSIEFKSYSHSSNRVITLDLAINMLQLC